MWKALSMWKRLYIRMVLQFIRRNGWLEWIDGLCRESRDVYSQDITGGTCADFPLPIHTQILSSRSQICIW